MSEVIVEITYDGTDLFDAAGTIGFRFTKGAPGEPPMVRGEDDVVAAASGRSSYPRLADVLPIDLAGWLHSSEGLDEAGARAFVESARQELLAVFAGGSLTPKALSAELPDGSTALISARVMPPILVLEIVPGLRYEFDVALESVDPAWVITPAGS